MRRRARPEDTVFEAVAGEALAHRARLRKPRAVEVNRRHHRNRIPFRVPRRPVAGITRRDVRA